MDETPALAVNARQAFEFFVDRLRSVTGGLEPPATELLYNASVLAHFATTSVASRDSFPAAPAGLSTVFELFVMDRSQHRDPDIMEAAAAQCLLLTGFFQDQQKRRHPIRWYAAIGTSFYAQAAAGGRNRNRAALMDRMAAHFEFWRVQQQRLAVDLAEHAHELQWPRLN
jgi:hypothetical protein